MLLDKETQIEVKKGGTSNLVRVELLFSLRDHSSTFKAANTSSNKLHLKKGLNAFRNQISQFYLVSYLYLSSKYFR
jgi:hypothetical protein